VPLFEPAFSGYFPSDISGLIFSALEYVKSFGLDGRLGSDFRDEFQKRVDALPEIQTRPGVAPFLAAVEYLVNGMSDEMTVDVLLEIMSACYEAILVSQLTGLLTLGMQEENKQCREAIAVQQRLIDQYVNKMD
jgi:hypothetical protein